MYQYMCLYTNKASSGQRENVILTDFGAKIWWKKLAPIWMLGRSRHSLEDHTYQGDVLVPPGWGMAQVGLDGDVEKGSITVDGEPVCPAASPPKYVTAGTCLGS